MRVEGPKNDGGEEKYGKKETVPVCMVVLSPNSSLRFLRTGQHAGESLKKWHWEHKYLLLVAFMRAAHPRRSSGQKDIGDRSQKVG